MLAYKMVIKLMVIGLCISSSIRVHSMDEDPERQDPARQLVNPVAHEARSSYLSWGISLPQSIRQSLFGNPSTTITMPVPTRPSRMATLCTPNSIKRILIASTAIALTTTVVYYTVGAYHGVVGGLEDTEAAAKDAYGAFEECRARAIKCEAAFDLLIEVCNNTLHKQ